MSKYLFNLWIKFYDITTQMKAESYLILRIKFNIFLNFALDQLLLALKFDWVKTCLFQITSHFTELSVLVTLSQETCGELHAVYLSR